MTHAPGTWYLAPVDDLSDEWSAGYDGNVFDSEDEAIEAAASLGECSPEHGAIEWVAVQRPISIGMKSTIPLGAPGSIARYLDEHRPKFEAPWVVFRYVPRSEEKHGIKVRAVQRTQAGAERYREDGDFVVDVRTYGCATLSATCSCGSPRFTDEDTCRICQLR